MRLHNTWKVPQPCQHLLLKPRAAAKGGKGRPGLMSRGIGDRNLTKHMKSKAHSKKCQELGVLVSSLVDLEAEEGKKIFPLKLLWVLRDGQEPGRTEPCSAGHPATAGSTSVPKGSFQGFVCAWGCAGSGTQGRG
ncbi:hypothetical protein IHE44_0008231 [Lamprotornis superbus]|uniref:Uncharacterized protein n=1 Tax=Lamprotornis superbus TaxID=245042 RepID=A0A835TWS6_9PASS|nr:hypothetical protein IHE44_0008231 [Lamprotornis superbus]